MHPLARKDSVVVLHGHHGVQLRPTLRAAILPEQFRGGWSGLLVKLAQLDTETIRAHVLPLPASSTTTRTTTIRSQYDRKRALNRSGVGVRQLAFC